MMAIEDNDMSFNSMFAFMSKSNKDEEDEVTFLDIKKNLKDYNLKELRSLENILIDSFCDLSKAKDS